VSIIQELLNLYRAKNEHFIYVNLEFFRKWKYLIKLIVLFNPRYRSCEIHRINWKLYHDIVVVGLRWTGKNVKRRTTGFAKEYLKESYNPKCLYCSVKLTQYNATTDHIIPISKGGNNSKVNLVVCCIKCNNERGDMDFKKYLELKTKKKSINFI